MVSGDWDEVVEAYVKGTGVEALYFNVSKGWKGTDFSFLSRLPAVAELNIIAAKCVHLEAMEAMQNLQSLSLTCDTRSTVDFSRLKMLRQCYLLWWAGAASLFEARQLEHLYLDTMRTGDFDAIGNLERLRYLTIANAGIDDLSPLTRLKRLERLELIDCRKLTTFDALARLTTLERLTVRGSKALSSLEFVRPLEHLEVLILSDNGSIDSLRPVEALRRLKALAFAGDTNIEDGDLSVLTGLPEMAMLMFAPRRHYSHKLIKKWNWKNFDEPDTLLAKK
jgi:internalin A